MRVVALRAPNCTLLLLRIRGPITLIKNVCNLDLCRCTQKFAYRYLRNTKVAERFVRSKKSCFQLYNLL